MPARSFLPFVAGGAIVTLLAGLVYAAVQQDMRQNANDPQIQLSEDLAYALTQGQDISPLKSATVVEMDKSLAPFFIITDEQKKILASSADLNGNVPLPPTGVFVSALTKQDRLTWQPRSDIRIALVVTHYVNKDGSGYVLVGRSLREIEKREQMLTWQVLVVWLVSIAILLGTFLLSGKKSRFRLI